MSCAQPWRPHYRGRKVGKDPGWCTQNLGREPVDSEKARGADLMGRLPRPRTLCVLYPKYPHGPKGGAAVSVLQRTLRPRELMLPTQGSGVSESCSHHGNASLTGPTALRVSGCQQGDGLWRALGSRGLRQLRAPTGVRTLQASSTKDGEGQVGAEGHAEGQRAPWTAT